MITCHGLRVLRPVQRALRFSLHAGPGAGVAAATVAAAAAAAAQAGPEEMHWVTAAGGCAARCDADNANPFGGSAARTVQREWSAHTAQHCVQDEEVRPYAPTTEGQVAVVAARAVTLARAAAAAFQQWHSQTHQGTQQAPPPPPLLFVLADSLSIDYGPHLQRALAGCFRYDRKNLRGPHGRCRAWLPGIGEGPRIVVANPGLDGCNGGDSGHMRRYLENWADSQQNAMIDGPTGASIMLMNSGLWDVKTNPNTRQRAVSVDEYTLNLEISVRLAREQMISSSEGGGGATAGLVIWVTTTPVDDHKHNVVYQQSWRRYNRDVRRYNEAAVALMRRLDVPVIDLYTFTAQKLGTASGRDHGHMTLAASQAQGAFLASEILRIVRESGAVYG